jgi:rRNA processing protein Gar1
MSYLELCFVLPTVILLLKEVITVDLNIKGHIIVVRKNIVTRKINKEKYERILKRLAQGESQQSIVIAEKCSYGTISAAKHWNKTWRSPTIATSNLTTNMTKIVLSIPNFWLERLNEDIVTGVWADYSDAVLDILRTYFRTRTEDVQPENRRPLNMRKKILGELKEVIGPVNENYTVPKKHLKHLLTPSYLEEEEKRENDRLREIMEEGQRISSMFQKDQNSEEFNFKNYHGQPLIQEEYDVLIELEKKIGVIPKMEYVTPKSANTDTVFPLGEKKELYRFSYVFLGIHIIGLIIRNKDLTSLPETIHNLKYLTYLDLRSNKLTKLPETIGELVYLDELILDNNTLTSIPESIGNLRTLTTIQLNSNNIATFPEFLENHHCDVGLADNNISAVPLKILHPSRQSVRIVDLTGNPVWDTKNDK